MFKHPPKLTQISKFVLVMLIFVTLCSAAQETNTEEDTEMKKEKIQIYPANPRYWQYRGEPTLLIGGSVEDNLFQIPTLKAHLELLKLVGGNYVRSTMSWVDEGDVPPFKKSWGPIRLKSVERRILAAFSELHHIDPRVRYYRPD